jgi:hypothetical protein
MENCGREIPLADMKGHLNEAHGASLRDETKESVTVLKDFGRNSPTAWIRPILFADEIFIHVTKIIQDKMYTCLLHVGLETNTAQFRYLVLIGCGGFGTKVSNYNCDLNNIFQSGRCGIRDYSSMGDQNTLKMVVFLLKS